MFDIGIGEILAILVVGLLVFGPERLPGSAARFAAGLRQLRATAVEARRSLIDSAGLDTSEVRDALGEFRRLRHGSLMDSVLPTEPPASPIERTILGVHESGDEVTGIGTSGVRRRSSEDTA